MKPRHLLSLANLDAVDLTRILDRASVFASGDEIHGPASPAVVGLLFFQPSTRTRVGFAVAAARLGGTSVEAHETKYQPGMLEAESLEDTVRAVGAYCDLLVIRHGSIDALETALQVAPVPVVCGGGGQRFHPTQALIDLYAIRKHLGRPDALRIGIAGDLRTSRSAHSFLRALAWYCPAEVRLMAPAGRGPDDSVLEELPASVSRSRRDHLDATDLDVLYMAGAPPGTGAERLSDATLADFFLSPERLTGLSANGIVLCALPRTGDIDPRVDADPRAVYFEQSADGLFVRMAVLEHFLSPAVNTPVNAENGVRFVAGR
ncbi:MAG: hypothetical protein GY835_09675 [bacterium]|nr:hypothetical protein [bacterium]